jgi:PAS domain S-box-containing protein
MLFAGRDLGDGTIVEFAVDIRARKQAEEAEWRLAAIIESSHDAIISKNLDGIITSWNRGAERLFGYRAEEAIGQPITILIPEDRQDEEPRILERLRRGERVDHFETVRCRKDGSAVEISLTISPVRNQQGRIVGASKIARDITERRRLEEQLLLVNRELHHRVKNTLATVQAVIASTARRAETIAEFQHAVTQRITSLAKTHTLLIEKEHGGASIRDILTSELAPYDDGTGKRVGLAGPDVRLPSEIAVAFGMAVHELTTNAAKYGAFSLPGGRVEVTWGLEEQADGGRLDLAWQERGGPPVEAPERQGFGSVLLQRALGRQLGGEVRTTFAPDGLQVRITAALPPQ